MHGEVIEMKLNEVDKAAITECFCNMFGCIMKLISLMLSEGKVLYKAIIDEIVCGMKGLIAVCG